MCESDDDCRKFLERTWGIQVEPDLRKLDGRRYAGTSLFTGGPPCQPTSRAGNQRGDGDDRWLWEDALRVLAEGLPDSCLFENPLGILDVGIDRILSQMERIGYEVQPFIIPACAVDSPQLRERVWIVGFLADTARNSQRGIRQGTGSDRERTRESGQQDNSSMADADSERGRENEQERGQDRRATDRRDCASDLADTTGAGSQGPSGTVWSVGDGERGRQKSTRSTPAHDQSLVADARCIDDDERQRSESSGRERAGTRTETQRFRGHWGQSVWVPCADGKVRRAPDDSQRMADGLPLELLEQLAKDEENIEETILEKASGELTSARPHKSLLAALGNAIVPQLAYEILVAMRKILER